MNLRAPPVDAAQTLFGVFGLGAFMYAVFGTVFLVLWYKDREPGLQWIGIGALFSVVFYTGAALGWSANPTRFMQPAWSAMVVEASIVFWAVGLAMYVDQRRWSRKWSTWIAVLPELGLAICALADFPVLRVVGNSIFYLSFLTLVPVVWHARKAEPAAGHEILALSLLVLPLSIAAFILLRVDVFYMRYVSIPSLLLFNVTLLVVSIQRRRGQLTGEVGRRTQAEQAVLIANGKLIEANASLESKVEERTATLRGMVAGLESFNRNVSHDLRGPLGGIEGIASLMRRGLAAGTETPDKLDRRLEMIEAQARHSYELVDAMLELAFVSNSALARSAVAMEPLVRDVVDGLRMADSARPVPRVVLRPLPTIEADAVLVKVVLTNLLSNAFKFTRSRPDALVEIGADLQRDVWIFSVRDNGPGFAPEAAGALFEPFKRLHGKDYAGHGVGLSIVRRIAERHGGKAWAEGSPGLGACFWFTLSQAA